ncbi:hypothetical protein [Cryobacterium sp. PH29-G1]|uniref:hypothetical protein n=1 Tax=Cryobacterium sp. PH29-G1 TaxID=3046211 RepID=UPI0024B8F907|nr:hypothetical protein [Cryobacterium sp. PH29-G1]MDJ0350197.1 hypothetical protein [Cryobacterium sp. PH29-G1]
MTLNRIFSRSARSRAHRIAAVTLCLTATIALVACSPQGNAANKWMLEHPIVQSSSMRLAGCEAMCDPTVTAEIKDSATDDQARRLARDSAEYLVDKNDLSISLQYHDVSVIVDHNATTTSSLADSWLVMANDPTVTSGYVSSSGRGLYTAKDQILSAYAGYSAANELPVDVSSTGDTAGFSVSNDARTRSADAADATSATCATNDALVAVAGDLLADTTVTSMDVSMCGDATVELVDAAALKRVAATLQALVAEPTLAASTFTVSVGGDTYSSSTRVVSVATAAYGPFLDFLDALPGVTQDRTEEGTISVTVDDVDRYAAVVTAINAEPRPAGLGMVTVNTEQRSLYVNGDGTVPEQLALLDSVAKLGTGAVAMYISPTAVKFLPPEYTAAKGHQIVDVVLASELWKTRPVTIDVFDRPIIFAVTWNAGGDDFTATRSDGTDATQKLISDIAEYWTAQRATA